MDRVKRGWILAAVVVAAVGIGFGVRALVGGSDPHVTPAATASESTQTPSPDPSPVPTPAATTAPDAIESDASELVAPFVSADAAARQNPDVPLALTEISTGVALDDLTIAVNELLDSGLRQIGAPVVVSAVLTDSNPAAAPPTATVLVCLDYSEVDLVNGSGQSAKDQHASQRVPTILTLVQQDGSWLVSDRTFPDSTTC